MITIEIAVKGLERIDLHAYGLHSRTDHYWRVRWFEQEQEVDHIELMEDLTGMTRLARQEGGAAWRYYETDVFADAQERVCFLEEHAIIEAV